MGMKGQRKYECVDCKSTQMEHWTAMQRRNKPRCTKCGSTFLNPYSEGAHEQFDRAAAARVVRQPLISGKASATGRENVDMRKHV